MNFDFELILTLIVILAGVISLIDLIFFAPKRKKQGVAKVPWAAEYARSFFPVLLLVLLLRALIVEPFRIPSGSDEPTLLVGDFIAANKYTYGFRLPVLHNKILAVDEPHLGDIILFRWPVNPSKNFIKRAVGVPGDTVSYVNKVLFINGKEAKQTTLGTATDKDDATGQSWPVEVREENLNGIKHKIYVRPDVPAQDFSLVVPPGQYFAMGDNRDDSDDSRYWGFVPEQNLVGKAFLIWFSWDNDPYRIRWERLGTRIT